MYRGKTKYLGIPTIVILNFEDHFIEKQYELYMLLVSILKYRSIKQRKGEKEVFLKYRMYAPLEMLV